CEPRGRSHPIAACTRVPEPDVVRDRAGEERRPLRYPREPAPPREQVRAVELLLAHRHATLGRRGQAEEQRGERALAAAARPDERDGLPGTQLEVDAVEHETFAGWVCVRDVLEPDEPLQPGG